jgi:hypothetical protein
MPLRILLVCFCFVFKHLLLLLYFRNRILKNLLLYCRALFFRTLDEKNLFCFLGYY